MSLIIKDLSSTIEKQDLLRIFDKYGILKSIEINKSKGSACVEYVKCEEAQKAYKRVKDLEILGKKCRVEYVQPPSRSPSRSITPPTKSRRKKYRTSLSPQIQHVQQPINYYNEDRRYHQQPHHHQPHPNYGHNNRPQYYNYQQHRHMQHLPQPPHPPPYYYNNQRHNAYRQIMPYYAEGYHQYQQRGQHVSSRDYYQNDRYERGYNHHESLQKPYTKTHHHHHHVRRPSRSRSRSLKNTRQRESRSRTRTRSKTSTVSETSRSTRSPQSQTRTSPQYHSKKERRKKKTPQNSDNDDDDDDNESLKNSVEKREKKRHRTHNKERSKTPEPDVNTNNSVTSPSPPPPPPPQAQIKETTQKTRSSRVKKQENDDSKSKIRSVSSDLKITINTNSITTVQDDDKLEANPITDVLHISANSDSFNSLNKYDLKSVEMTNENETQSDLVEQQSNNQQLADFLHTHADIDDELIDDHDNNTVNKNRSVDFKS